jgi:hypothetical protein
MRESVKFCTVQRNAWDWAAGLLLYANQSPATEESHGDVLSPDVLSMDKARLIEAGLLCTHVGDPPAVLVTQVEYLHTTTA